MQPDIARKKECPAAVLVPIDAHKIRVELTSDLHPISLEILPVALYPVREWKFLAFFDEERDGDVSSLSSLV